MVSARPDSTDTESTPPPSAALDRRWLGFALFLVSFLLYIPLLPPTISRGGDCGELTAASWLLGIAHPTGYPLYILAGKAFAMVVPFGEIAWRYNLFSALLSSVAIALITITAHRLTAYSGRRSSLWAAGSAGAMLAATGYFGSQALIAEVYSLNAILLAALLYCAVAWHQDADWRWFYSLALLTGLTLFTHLSCLFLLPGLFLLAVWAHRDRFSFARGVFTHIVPTFGLLLAGAALLLYFPQRSGLFPPPPVADPIGQSAYWPLDWGHPATPERIKNHALAKQYNNLLLQPGQMTIAGKALPEPVLPLPKWGPRFLNWLSFGLLQLLWACPLVFIGAYLSWRDRAIGLALTLTVLLNAVEFGYMVSDLANFFFPTYIVAALWLAFGFAGAASLARRIPEQNSWRFRFKFLAQGGVIITVLLQWMFFATAFGWKGSRLAHNAALEQAKAAETIYKQTGKRAIVCLPTDDFRWAFWYVRFVEGRGAKAAMPWGRRFTLAKEGGKLPNAFFGWGIYNPVVVGWLDDSFAQRYTFVPANEVGNLWMLHRSGVQPKLLPGKHKILGPNGLVQAKLRRHPLWKLNEKGVPGVLRGGLAALDLDFVPPQDSTQFIGTVEVLFAKPGAFPGKPSPTQGNKVKGEHFETEVPIWRQGRRFNYPLQAGQGTIWRTSVPIQIDDDAPIVTYDLWTRIVRGNSDTTTPWTRTDRIRVVTR